MAFKVYWVTSRTRERDVLERMAQEGFQTANRIQAEAFSWEHPEECGQIPVFAEFTNSMTVYRVSPHGRVESCWLGGGVAGNGIVTEKMTPFFDVERRWLSSDAYWRDCGLLAVSR